MRYEVVKPVPEAKQQGKPWHLQELQGTTPAKVLRTITELALAGQLDRSRCDHNSNGREDYPLSNKQITIVGSILHGRPQQPLSYDEWWATCLEFAGVREIAP